LQIPKLREPNNHTAKQGADWLKLANAVVFTYGHTYQRAADYLTQIARNDLWREAELSQLPWHRQIRTAPPVAEARYVVHDCVLNALAPAMPLKAIWQGNRRE